MGEEQTFDMAVRATDMVSRIGRTPMRHITLTVSDVVRRLWLKLESHNPGGSIKDRTAYALIDALEARGELEPGSVVVESTSGNLGVALAGICLVKGYRLIAVVDPKTSRRHVAVMRELGASVETVYEADVHHSYLQSRIERVQEILRQVPRSVWTNQYENPANPRIHYEQTGPEILRQCPGPPDAIFVAASTGGTLAGIARYFAAVSPATEVVGVDVAGSRALGGPAGRRVLSGIGSSRVSSFVRREQLRATVHVSDAAAIAACVRLRQRTRLWLGGSSGAVIAACVDHLRTRERLTDVICVCPDGGERYVETIYDPAWLACEHIDVDADAPPELGTATVG